jgi:hypothetical protein
MRSSLQENYLGYDNDRNKSDIVELRGKEPEREGEEEDMSSVSIV